MDTMDFEKTEAQQARELAHKFRQQHPELIRETVIDMPQWAGLSYGEVPVDDNGNVGLYRHIGTGGRMQCTTGNVLIYNRGDWWDYSVILPNMSCDDTFTEDEQRIGEMWGMMGVEE